MPFLMDTAIQGENMGVYLSLLIVNLAIYLDARTLQQEAEDVYADIMKYSPRKWTILAFLLFIVVAPWYYYRRHKFLTHVYSRTREDLSAEVNIFPEEPSFQEFATHDKSLAGETTPAEKSCFPKPNPLFLASLKRPG